MEKYKKIAIVGCGTVGMTIAHAIVIEGLCDELFLISNNRTRIEGEVLDLRGGLSYLEHYTDIKIGDYANCSDVDIIVFAAGSPPAIGETRLDNWEKTKKICDIIFKPIMDSGFRGIFVVVSNPVDQVTGYIQKITGIPHNQVIGTGTGVDTSRLKNHIAQLIGMKPQEVKAYCIGEHNDSLTIPWERIPYDIDDENKNNILEIIRQEGWNICEKKGKTCYGISMTCIAIIKAILSDSNQEMVVSAIQTNELNGANFCCGVRAVLNHNGIAKILT